MGNLTFLLPPADAAGNVIVDLRGGVATPPPGATGSPGGGGATGATGVPPPLVLPANLEVITPYPLGVQTFRDRTVGDIPRGFAFTIPANAPPHNGIIKVFGLPGECFRDRRMDVNGVVWRDWWQDPSQPSGGLSIRTDDDYSVGNNPGDIKPGSVVYFWMRHPYGEVFTDRWELLANR